VTFFHSFPARLLLLTVTWCFLATISSVLAAEPARPDALKEAQKEAQAAFNKQQYDQALQLLESLVKSGNVAPDVRRLKARTLAKAGKPQDALAEYEGITTTTKKDELPLLREVAFGFIVPMLKDMRVQMRGVGYTALGSYRMTAWHPYVGTMSEEIVEVKPDGTVEVNFSMKAPAGRRTSHQVMDNPRFGLEALGHPLHIEPLVQLQQ